MKAQVLTSRQFIWQWMKAMWKDKFLVWTVIVACSMSLFYVLMNRRHFNFCSSTFYEDIMYPVITMLTFFTALFIGIFNIFREWKNSLEKRLTVFYIYYYDSIDTIERIAKDKMERKKDIDFIKEQKLDSKTPYCLMVCEEASLAHEGDIRAWGQQLGGQIEGGRIDFYPFYSLGKNHEIVRVSDSLRRIHYTRQYLLFVFLEKVPEIIYKKKSGLLVTDNYDDTPTNIKKNFKIVEFRYKDHLNYVDARRFIKSLK